MTRKHFFAALAAPLAALFIPKPTSGIAIAHRFSTREMETFKEEWFAAYDGINPSRVAILSPGRPFHSINRIPEFMKHVVDSTRRERKEAV